ncbi:MAG: DUF3102 domain-containing protein [Oscillospiraceae bacterium]|nr:DUF3102 domain-containing protein [Oscillospiraceae bacterium]
MSEERIATGGGAALAMTKEGEPARTLEVIGAEIRALTVAVAVNVIEIGRRLVEAKELLPHGEFLNWVKENTGYSSSTANNYMTIYHRVASKQLSLFGAEVENFQAFGNLGYAKLIELTKIKSDEEMEEFVETHDVEAMSTRELKEAIRERDEARKAQAEAEAREKEAREELSETAEMLDKTLDERNARGVLVREREEQLKALEKELAELKARPVDVAVQQPDPDAVEARAAELANKAKEELEQQAAKEVGAAEEKAAKAAEALKKAEEKAKAEREKLEAKLKEAEGKLTAAGEADKAEAEKLRAEAEDLRKQLSMSSQEIVVFKLRFMAWQEAHKQMAEAFTALDEETKEKMRAAIRAQVKAWGWAESEAEK